MPDVSPATPRTIDLDARGLRAVAHPLRLRILQHLQTDGPATSAVLAKRLGESTGTLSWHLRLLAGYGLIGEDPERGTRRERWWRALEGTINAEARTFLGDPQLWAALSTYAREHVAWYFRLVADHLRAAEARELGPEWLDASGISSSFGSTTGMTAPRLKAMRDEAMAVIQRHLAEARAAGPEPGAEPVIAISFFFPHRPGAPESAPDQARA